MLALLLSIISAGFLLQKVLSFLNHRHSKQTPDAVVSDVYNQEKYSKWLKYSHINYRFGFLTSFLSFCAIFLLLLFDGFAYCNSVTGLITPNELLAAPLFFGLLFFIADIAALPFDIYDTFVIEQQFGFNKTTIKTYITDKLKSYFLAVLIGGGLILLIAWIYRATGEYFWIYAWASLSIFSIFMAMFYSNIIVPLFNKQTPLEEGPLRHEIETFCHNTGYSLKNIYIIDGSKRSTRANAYFTGLGPKKRIVLYDTLLKQLENSEIVAVLAHEIGHYKKGHVLTGLIISLAESALMFWLLSLFLKQQIVYDALGVSTPVFHIGLVAFGVIYSPVSLLLGLISNVVSRKNEYAADNYAMVHQQALPLISGLKKLASNNLSNLSPHPWYVFFHYSHPPLHKRIATLAVPSKMEPAES